ncbi:MAG TPA: YihY/virulence factor BrkB family protein [Mycobacteriales bacterium]|jgi:YihY family inner membrane protein|nr:YihY/virulence factor BrkB family protein [Mycobacteriales bacterium]
MSVAERVDGFQRRHPWAGFSLAVVYKFYDDRGPHLAAIITYYGFVSLFPLLLLFATVLGFVLQGNPSLQHTLVHSALSDFPIVGPQIEHNISAYKGSGAGLVVGIVGTLYGGLGVTQAAQAVFNRIYAVPRNKQPNPFTSRLRSLLLLVLLGTGVLVTTGLSAMTTDAHAFGGQLGFWVRIAALVFAFLVNVALFVGAFQVLTAKTLQTREVALGGFVAALGWQILQSAGTYYLSHKLRHASEVYGVFGLVLGLIAWIYLEAMVVVLSAELNVVLHDRLWPRSLLTPFTDDVELTRADVSVYTSYARSERYKGFENVDVTFDPPPTE